MMVKKNRIIVKESAKAELSLLGFVASTSLGASIGGVPGAVVGGILSFGPVRKHVLKRKPKNNPKKKRSLY